VKNCKLEVTNCYYTSNTMRTLWKGKIANSMRIFTILFVVSVNFSYQFMF